MEVEKKNIASKQKSVNSKTEKLSKKAAREPPKRPKTSRKRDNRFSLSFMKPLRSRRDLIRRKRKLLKIKGKSLITINKSGHAAL